MNSRCTAAHPNVVDRLQQCALGEGHDGLHHDDEDVKFYDGEPTPLPMSFVVAPPR